MRTLLLITAVLLSAHAIADPLRAAVAANFRDTFEVLASSYVASGGDAIEASYAASGMLAKGRPGWMFTRPT